MANKIACMIIVSMLVIVIAPHAQAITCGQVVADLMPCLGYLKNGGAPTGGCCNGARAVNSAASTTPDRRVACACIKQAAQSYGINYNYANSLPGKCGVHVDYTLTPALDCSTVN